MKIAQYILFYSSLCFLPLSFATQSPCGPQISARNCNAGREGWRQIAIQHYDKESPVISIWEKNAQRVMCEDPGLASCVSYGGNLEQFKADAARETAARAKLVKDERDRQAAIDAEVKRQMKDHGEELKKNGWRERARCDDGHEWSYVIEKAGQRRLCTGINARGGPSEDPCRPFTGDLNTFQRLADEAKKYRDDYDKASRAGVIDQFLKEAQKKKSIPHCWSDSARK